MGPAAPAWKSRSRRPRSPKASAPPAGRSPRLSRNPDLPMKRNRPTRLAPLLALALVALVATGCASQIPAFYPPQDATSQGKQVRDLYDIVFIIAAVIFFAVEALIVYAVIRYRRKPTDTELPPQTHGNNLIEIIWTLIPTVIVIFLFVISWQTLNT